MADVCVNHFHSKLTNLIQLFPFSCCTVKRSKEKEKRKFTTQKKKDSKSLWVRRVLLADCAVYAQGTDAAIT